MEKSLSFKGFWKLLRSKNPLLVFFIVLSILSCLIFFSWTFTAPIFLSSNTLIFGGSTSVLPVLDKLQIKAGKRKNIAFSYQPVGSGGGISGVRTGRFDIGFVSKEYKSNENIKAIKMADERAVFVYSLPKNCSFAKDKLSVTKKEIIAIYSADKYDWSSLSNVNCIGNAKMSRIVRENGSGTQSSFSNIFFSGDQTAIKFEMTEKNGRLVLATIKLQKGAIGFVGGTEILEADKIGEKELLLEEVSYSDADQDYVFSRPFYLLYLESKKVVIQDFLKFLNEPSTKDLINETDGLVYTFKY